jgi:hypothetical protein
LFVDTTPQATRTVESRRPSRPRPMGTARRPRAVIVHSKSCRCRDSEASRRVPAWVGSVLREGPCGELAPIAPAYHRPRSGGGAGTPFRPTRGAARPPPPRDCHVRGLTEVRVGPPGASTCNEHAAFSSGCGPYLSSTG